MLKRGGPFSSKMRTSKMGFYRNPAIFANQFPRFFNREDTKAFFYLMDSEY
jgi:hypothetical protein